MRIKGQTIRVKAEGIYRDYFISKVFDPKQGRWLANLEHSLYGFKTTSTYARYLMEVKLERFLTRHEEVDHRDDNKQNDSLENLQILDRCANMQKEGRRRRKIIHGTLHCYRYYSCRCDSCKECKRKDNQKYH